MSGVLERMAKRALGALPTVQPLTAPLYASPARGLRDSIFDLETNLEIEAPAPRRHRPSRTQQTQRNPELHDHPQNPDSSRMPAPPVRGETRRAHGRVEDATPSSDESREEPRTEARKRAETEQVVKSDPVEPEHSAASFLTSKESSTRVSRMDLDKEPAIDDADAIVSEIEARKTDLDDRNSLARVDGPLPAPPELARQAMPAPIARRESATPIDQKTEIHISIGSIELRAPRSEAKPVATPFRPRVTLEDFLRRKPEAGA